MWGTGSARVYLGGPTQRSVRCVELLTLGLLTVGLLTPGAPYLPQSAVVWLWT